MNALGLRLIEVLAYLAKYLDKRSLPQFNIVLIINDPRPNKSTFVNINHGAHDVTGVESFGAYLRILLIS